MKLELTKIEAASLEDAYTKAAEQLGCSITDLEFEIVQNPSKGFLGLGRKTAIIVAAKKPNTKQERLKEKQLDKHHGRHDEKDTPNKPIVLQQNEDKEQKSSIMVDTKEYKPKEKKATAHFEQKFSDIENGFFDEKMEIDDICQEVEIEINKLFKASCFELDRIEVSKDDTQTLLIKFTGNDSALLIGKEGYRYNALAYLLFNWINPKYKIGIKLEIAEFLQNQEEIVKKYVETVVLQVRNSGQARTKPLDGVLLQIAVRELRCIFPEKYVGVKSSDNGSKFIVVNEFSRKN